MRKLVASWFADYGEWADGHVVVDVAVGFDGCPILLLVPMASVSGVNTRVLPRQTRGVLQVVPRRHRIVHLANDGARIVETELVACTDFQVQPLRDDRWLLLSSNEDGPHLLLSADGPTPLPLDGVWYAGPSAATSDGQIWTGYGDQSAVKWRCHDLAGHQLADMDDFEGLGQVDWPTCVYAMTVGSDGHVYTYTYSGFSLYALSRGGIERAWTNLPSIGSEAFAVTGNLALFGVGYRADDRLMLVDLQGTPRGWHHVETAKGGFHYHRKQLRRWRCRVVDEADQPLRIAREAGRGPLFYLFGEKAIHQLDLEALRSRPGSLAPALSENRYSGLAPALGPWC